MRPEKLPFIPWIPSNIPADGSPHRTAGVAPARSGVIDG